MKISLLLALACGICSVSIDNSRAGVCGPGAAPEGEFSIDPEIKDEEEEGAEEGTPTYYLFPDQQATLSGTATDQDCHCGHPASDSFENPSGHKWTTTAGTLGATQGASVTITAPANEPSSAAEADLKYAADDKGTPHDDGGFVDLATSKIVFPKFQLIEVTYSGCIEWMTSDDEETEYSGPHASDENNNGSIEDEGDRKYPVCYQKSTDVWISAKWKVVGDKKPPAGTKFYVKLEGPGGLGTEDKETDYDAETGEITFPKGGSETSGDGKVGTVGAAVAAYNGVDAEVGSEDESFKWSLGVDGTETTHYFPAGSNKNALYVILGQQEGEDAITLLESLVAISCSGADGKSDADTAFSGIWAKFAAGIAADDVGTPIKNVNGNPLTYWGPAATADGPGHDSYQELILTADGRCGAWANLLVILGKLQGAQASPRTMVPKNFPPLTGIAFYVKSWTYKGTNVEPVRRADGLIGQNNLYPDNSVYANHVVVKYNDKYYDPSYGKSFDTLGEWETKSLDVFRYIGPVYHLNIPMQQTKWEDEE